MGKASRWLKALLAGGSKKASPNTAQGGGNGAKVDPKPTGEDRSLARSFRDEDMSTSDGPSPGGDTCRGRSLASVAAASAVVAHAAVATAQAAAAVVKLAGVGRVDLGAKRMGEASAALKIQKVFRGYLARKALKALKGLVKIQALVRGHIVRKQANQTFRCMQALLRVQARARTCRQSLTHPHLRHEDYYPVTPATSTQRATPSVTKRVTVDSDMLRSGSWKWLDKWMEQRYWDAQGGRTTASTGAGRSSTAADEANVKVVEVDNGRPLPTNPRCLYYPSSPAKQPAYRLPTSPLGTPVDYTASCDGSQIFSGGSSRHCRAMRRATFSPTTSDCSGSFFSGYTSFPNYMAYTESAKAKARPASTSNYRPEVEQFTVPAKRTTAVGY